MTSDPHHLRLPSTPALEKAAWGVASALALGWVGALYASTDPKEREPRSHVAEAHTGPLPDQVVVPDRVAIRERGRPARDPDARPLRERRSHPRQGTTLPPLRPDDLLGSVPAAALTTPPSPSPRRAPAGIHLVVTADAAEARLVDADGTVRHTWARTFDEVFDRWLGERHRGAALWRRVRLLDDGDLLVLFHDHGIARLDRDSQVVWARPVPGLHDLDVQPSGNVVTLISRTRRDPHLSGPAQLDAVVVLDPGGVPVAELSVLDAYVRAPAHRWRRGGDPDPFGARAITVVREPIAETPFTRGAALVALHRLGTLALLDGRGRLAWAVDPPIAHPHDVDLHDGRLVVFDGGDATRAPGVREVDPVAGTAQTLPVEVRPECCGSVQALPGGHTLVVDGAAGRALEVDADGATVWFFDAGRRRPDQPEIVATLLQCTRLDDEDLAWLKEPGDG